MFWVLSSSLVTVPMKVFIFLVSKHRVKMTIRFIKLCLNLKSKTYLMFLVDRIFVVCNTTNWGTFNYCQFIGSADLKVSSAELMVLLTCPSSVVVHRPSVNFCFKSLLLLQFLFDHSEFFTGETRHIVPPCNKAGISNFCLEFQKLQKFEISSKRYSSFSSYSIILKFLLEKLGI